MRVIQGTLILSPPALKVLFVLLLAANRTGNGKIKRTSLIERTGYTKNSVIAALAELRAAKLITSVQTFTKHKEFSTNQYCVAVGQYFTLPRCMVQSDTQHSKWALSKLTSSEIKVYVCLCWLGDKNHSNAFVPKNLQHLTGLKTTAAFENAMDGLEFRGLISIGAEVTLCDPYTGLPIPDVDEEMESLQNQFTTIRGITRPTDFNFEKTPEYMKRLFESLGLELKQSKGNYTLHCLYHDDSKPSLCVSPRGMGFFQCFGCQHTGTLSDLVMHVTGLTTRLDALRYMLEINGSESHFVDPDKNYIVYSFRDTMGFIKKQELRHRTKPKSITQRVPVGSGWSYKHGPPMLYNLDKLRAAYTAFMVEGCKDCETIGRHIHDIVATTSGSSTSWQDSLAEDLKGKKVVLMPDNDPDGTGDAYMDKVAESLTTRGIMFTRISFAEDHVKDVSDYLLTHTVRDLFDKIGKEVDWFLPEPIDELVDA